MYKLYMLSKYELSMFFLNFIIMKQVKSCKLIIKNIDLSILNNWYKRKLSSTPKLRKGLKREREKNKNDREIKRLSKLSFKNLGFKKFLNIFLYLWNSSF